MTNAPPTYRVLYGALPTKRRSRMPLWLAVLVPLLAVLIPILMAAQSVIEYGFGDGFLCIATVAVGGGAVIAALLYCERRRR